VTVVRTLSRINVRRGAPSIQAAIARVIPADTELTVSGFVDRGEAVQGNACWYCDESDGFFWAGATSVPQPIVDDGLPEPSSDTATTDEMAAAQAPAPAPSLTAAAVTIDRTKFVLPPKEFAHEEFRKDLVVLHFTAGRSAESAFNTWRQDPQRIATAYLVDVDGTIYEVFPPQFWAAHLGVKGTNNAHDRRSIGIEIANVGPLQPAAGNPSVLNWWPKASPGAPDFTTKFCTLAETDRYVEGTYRGKSHFASFPAVQIAAIGPLVRALCQQFSIPQSLPPLSRRFDCDLSTFVGYKGVCTHANFRQDKWDIGPVFPWEALGL